MTSMDGSLAARYPLVPWPRALEARPGRHVLGPGSAIVLAGGASQRLGHLLAEYVREGAGVAVPLAASGAIRLAIDAAVADGPEAYELDVGTDAIALRASGERGLIYGIQTLRQLITEAGVPAVRITDAPRFTYRGLHLDVGRHFFPPDFIKKYIRTMASFKLNTFHWHLTEDQGWRLEIERYPKLTSVGAWRKETVVGHARLESRGYDGTPHGGFYTQDEARDIVAYAAAHGVTVLPEIEMPGHTVAALAAYPELACTPGPFEVRTTWGVSEDVLCPSEATFTFLENVLREVMAIFPVDYIHIGGDEAPKTRWRASELAQAVIAREGLRDEDELQSWFIRRIESFLNANGRRLIGWDEILEGGLAPDATVMSWRGTAGGIAAAQQGHDVIMCPQEHLYFDHYQGDPEREPLAIGYMTTLEETYAYEPVPAELTPDEARHILGPQGNVWTEYMPTPEHVEYMAYPRALALAEMGWSQREARDWQHFGKRLPAALAVLDRMGVRYRAPGS